MQKYNELDHNILCIYELCKFYLHNLQTKSDQNFCLKTVKIYIHKNLQNN